LRREIGVSGLTHEISKYSMRQRTNPDTRGGGLAKVDDAIADGKRHRFVIFAPPDAYSRTWVQR
jgi:hypothetical protein